MPFGRGARAYPLPVAEGMGAKRSPCGSAVCTKAQPRKARTPGILTIPGSLSDVTCIETSPFLSGTDRHAHRRFGACGLASRTEALEIFNKLFIKSVNNVRAFHARLYELIKQSASHSC